MADRFEHNAIGMTSVAVRHTAVTPSDSVDIPYLPRALYCTGAGDVAVVDIADNVIVYTLAVGDILPFRAKRVNATDTNATVIAWE